MGTILLINTLLWMTWIPSIDCHSFECSLNRIASTENTCYEIIERAIAFNIADASRDCEAINGSLATLYTTKDASGITEFLDFPAYTGLTKIKTSEFTWMDGSSYNKNQWEKNEPDNQVANYNGSDISCAILVDGIMKDYTCCGGIVTHAICEIGSQPVDASFITDHCPTTSTTGGQQSTEVSSEFSVIQTQSTIAPMSVYSKPATSKTSEETSVFLDIYSVWETSKPETPFVSTTVLTTFKNVIEVTVPESAPVQTGINMETQTFQTKAGIESNANTIITETGRVILVSSMGESSMTDHLNSLAIETSISAATIELISVVESEETSVFLDIYSAGKTIIPETQFVTTAVLTTFKNVSAVTVSESAPVETRINGETQTFQTKAGIESNANTITTETGGNILVSSMGESSMTDQLDSLATETSIPASTNELISVFETSVTRILNLDSVINTVDASMHNTISDESSAEITTHMIAMTENTESMIGENSAYSNTDVGAVTAVSSHGPSTTAVAELQTQVINETTTTEVPTKDVSTTAMNNKYSTATKKNNLPLRPQCWRRICPNKQSNVTKDDSRIFKNETSAYRRRHTCANDERLSSAGIGCFVLSLLFALVIFLILDDLKMMWETCVHYVPEKRPQKAMA